MYLDPGSGSVLIQAILAGILGIGVFIKIYWQKINSLFRPEKSEKLTQVESIKDQKGE